MTEQTCSERVYDRGGFHFYPCGRRGKVERDGKWYCGIHDPAKKAARRAHSNAVGNAKSAVWSAERNLAKAKDALIEEALTHPAMLTAANVLHWREKLAEAKAALLALEP